MKEQPLISIIIPAYNVEPYIEKCVRSALEQTYPLIEVIVINDGSTDQTPVILDNLAKQHSNLRIIHKNNEGVSAARNDGINATKSDYLIFVDGDDFIAPDYTAYMMHLIQETDADFCLSTKYFVRQNEAQTENESVKTYSAEDATALMLSPDTIMYSPNKIFKKSFIEKNHLSFSKNLFYGEGLTFITDAAQVAEKVGIGNRKVYYYRRNNENSATTKFNIQKIKNGEKALLNIRQNLKIYTKTIHMAWTLHMSVFYLGAMVNLKRHKLIHQYNEEYNAWRSFIFKNYPTLFFSKEVSLYRKALLLGGMLSPWFVGKLDILRRKRIKRNSFID